MKALRRIAAQSLHKAPPVEALDREDVRTQTVLGIDVSARRGLDLVVLDVGRQLAADPVRILADTVAGQLEDTLKRLAPSVIAIDAPSQWGIAGPTRSAELSLRRRGLSCYSTPSDPSRRSHPFYAWVLVGLAVHEAADRAGFPVYDGHGPVAGRAVEVFPHAAAVALRGMRPPPGWRRTASGKRAWRLAALAAAGVVDHRLRSQDQIDAALAAVTASAALAGAVDVLGDPVDGVIVVPRQGASHWARNAQKCRSEAQIR